MPCPLGSFINPETGKCILVNGDVAKDLIKRGIVNPYMLPQNPYPQNPYPQNPYPQNPYPQKAKSVYYPYGYQAPVAPVQYPRPVAAKVQPPYGYGYVKNRCDNKICELGKECNPASGKCRKIQRKTMKRMPVAAYPPTAPKPKSLTSKASVAPFADRESILGWASSNCRNTIDPVSKKPFASYQNVSDMIRLHNGTCTLASGLHAKVVSEHKAGKIATIPGDPNTHMIVDDFNAMRDAMRRTNPSYRVPGHKHTPPPPEWKLYIASDNFSGPEFVSVAFLDITKGKQGPHGIQYPVDSIRVNMGYVPIHVPYASCSLSILTERIKQAHIAGKLLVPVAGGWKPIAGFPFKKEDWKHNTAAKMNRLCDELTKVLNTVS